MEGEDEGRVVCQITDEMLNAGTSAHMAATYEGMSIDAASIGIFMAMLSVMDGGTDMFSFPDGSVSKWHGPGKH